MTLLESAYPPLSPLRLPYISPTSPPIFPLHLSSSNDATRVHPSPPIPPLYLPYVSPASPQHHMTLLESAIASHPDLLEATGGGVSSGAAGGVSSGAGAQQQARFRCVEVRLGWG